MLDMPVNQRLHRRATNVAMAYKENAVLLHEGLLGHGLQRGWAASARTAPEVNNSIESLADARAICAAALHWGNRGAVWALESLRGPDEKHPATFADQRHVRLWQGGAFGYAARAFAYGLPHP